MRINIKVINISSWIAALSIFLFPGKLISHNSNSSSEYGFPIKFLTIHPEALKSNQWLITNVSIQLLYFFIDVVLFYCLISILLHLNAKVRAHKGRR